MMEIFGLQISKKKKEEKLAPSFVPPMDTDGAIDSAQTNVYGYDFDASYKNTSELLSIYRKMAAQSDVSYALEEIINDSIVFDSNEVPVSIDFSQNSKISKSIRSKIVDEFNYILKKLRFNEIGDEIFRNWFVDGRIFFHIVTDKNSKKDGIVDIRFIDPRHIKKVVDVKKEKNANGVEVVKSVEEYYVYNPNIDSNVQKKDAVKIPKEAIIHASSGVKSPDGKEILSYLHPAIKPYNQLMSLEDSLVIYRISRAPERRIFYVDVGNLPKTRAEQYMKSIINKHNNKIVYDTNTGTIKDKKHIMSMMEDIWLPRREGSRGTEVDTLSGAQSLGDMEDVIYFFKKLYKALRIPSSRLESDTMFNVGHSSEITREEIKFSKYIDKLRKKFSKIFRKALKTQLILKNIITENDWDEINEIIQFKFNSDSQFTELKNSEILQNRLEILSSIDEYVGDGGYYSKDWVRKHVLNQSDEEIKEIDKQNSEDNSDAPNDGIPPEDNFNDTNPAAQVAKAAQDAADKVSQQSQ